MYRTSTQEPRYKHSLYERDPRHVEPRELSEEYSSSSEEEEESSGKYTEESDEETIESQESYSLEERSEWNPAFERQWSYNKLEKPEKNKTNHYICDTRIYKQDKVTQKNLLSPFPSFLIPPIPRKVVESPYYRLPSVRSPKEAQNNFKNPAKYAPRKSKNYKEEEGVTYVIHRNRDCNERKVHQKPKVQKEQMYELKVSSSDRVLLPRESPEESFRNFSKSRAETESFSKRPMFISKCIKRPKSLTRENANNQPTVPMYTNRTLEHETKEKSRPKTAIGVVPCEKDSNTPENFLARNIGDGKLANKKGGEVKEKLMYVVEEEGKEVTKLETDLFTLNEILAIKKDLLELSEFAKKLKKLKETRKESETAKTKENKCQCKPAEELLKDVNRRIEVLEARQEELERGNSKVTQKGDVETDSKNTNVTKISSGLQSKTPAIIQSSATTTVPTRPEGFSNNSDIVKELMDIKTQLQRLEKRRTSKEVSNEVLPEGSTKLSSNKNRAIAVFSSKTYIFTNENFDKRKMVKKVKKEEKGKNHVPSFEENKAKSQLKKANVASWLKNVKVEQMETDVSMFLSKERLKKKENDLEKPKESANVKCRNCFQASKVKDLENQEPQKNRVLETDERKGDNSFGKLLKNESSISEINRYVKKKCVMTPSGRLFALMCDSNDKVLNIPSACKLKLLQEASPQWLPSQTAYRSSSSESITSAILAKQQVRELKAQKCAGKHCKESPSQSRSLQELSLNSNYCKIKKITRNVETFGETKASPLPKGKKNKEAKNEFFKHLETHLMTLEKNFEKQDITTSSCTYSEFLASINLDSEEASATLKSSTLQKNIASNEIYTYMASTKANFKALDSQALLEKNNKERKKKKEKKEKKNSGSLKKPKLVSAALNEIKTLPIQEIILQNELKKKSKPKKEKKCKEPMIQKKCKKKKKKIELPCKDKNTNYSNFWKSYYTDDCFKYNEKKPASNDSKIPNEDNLEIYRKREAERSKTNLHCKKSIVDSFTIRNIFKNLGRYYPKISNFSLFPFSRGDFCNKLPEEPLKRRLSQTRITDKSEVQEKKYEICDEDNENNEDCDHTSDSYACQSVHCNKHSDERHRNYYCQITKPDDLKNCRCVQVYLQTQDQRGLSGLGPFRPVSAESTTNDSASRSTGSCQTKKNESFFSVQNSQIQYVSHSTQACDKKKPKSERECKKCKVRKKCKKCKKCKKEKKNKRKVCVCCKCGNVHKLKKKKKKCKCECPNKTSETCELSDSDFRKRCSCGEKPPCEASPMLSFFSNFCKPKPRESKFPKSIINKISEVRYLKTCSRVQTNFFSKLRNQLVRDPKSSSKYSCCHCIQRFEDIEKKLNKLENEKSCDCCCKGGEGRKKRKKKESPKKKKKKKKCYCTDSGESKSSPHSAECVCCEVDKKKKSKKSKKKKKKKDKKHKSKCCCCECKDDQKSSKAYYYTVQCHSSTVAASGDGTISTKTTEEEEKKKKLEKLLEQKRLKENLPSPTPYWQDIQNYKVTESQTKLKNMKKIKNKSANIFEPEITFFNDYSKGDSRARNSQDCEIRENINSFLRKIAEIKKRRKEAKAKEKKEKKR